MALTSSMAELERTAVQLWEAKRLADKADVPHGRLALLLLDNAVEMSLLRSAKGLMAFAHLYNNAAYMLKDVEPGDEEGGQLKREIESKSLSRSKQKRIERDFTSSRFASSPATSISVVVVTVSCRCSLAL
jgi:hypothetical protein